MALKFVFLMSSSCLLSLLYLQRNEGCTALPIPSPGNNLVEISPPPGAQLGPKRHEPAVPKPPPPLPNGLPKPKLPPPLPKGLKPSKPSSPPQDVKGPGNTTKESTLLEKLLLAEDRKDPCLQLSTRKARQECIQPVLETYYGDHITDTCPELSLILAGSECTGCPWNRINPSALAEIGRIDFPLQPRHQFFQNAEHECRIADHVWVYRNWKAVLRSVFHIGLIVSVFLFVVSAIGAVSGPEKLLSCVPEVVCLVLLWTAFYIAYFLLVAVDDYYKYCESLTTYWTHNQLLTVAFATTLTISMSRCLRLPYYIQTADGDEQMSSWCFFVAETMCNKQKYKKGRIVLALAVSCLPVVLCGMLLFDYAITFDDSTIESWCVAGQKDYKMGAVQYSKLALEFLSVTVYAMGPKRGSKRLQLRYCALFGIICCSWAVGFICIFSDAYKPNGHTMLIPRILDRDIAGHATELVHANVVSILGLLEPLRKRCESKPHDTKT